MGTALGSEVESVVVLRAARASLSGALLRAAAPRACVPHAARGDAPKKVHRYRKKLAEGHINISPTLLE